MRLHFQEKPWDLYLVIGYSIVLGFGLLTSGTGNLLAILLVLFTPGYVVVAALFPGRAEIDWIERIALSVGLSIAVVPLLGLLLNFTPFGIRLPSIVATVTAFASLVGLAAYWRRMRLDAPARLSATFEFRGPDWAGMSRLDQVITGALAASIVVAAGSLAYVIAVPRPGEAFTEFYVLGPNGTAEDYPSVLNVSEPGRVVIGIVNHEQATVDYTVRIDLVGVEIVFNATSGRNETVERNRTTLDWYNETLGSGGTSTQNYTFSIANPGDWKVQFLLYRDADFASAYRSLHLFVRVNP